MDYGDIFSALNKRKIRYLVVGGLAVNLYGVSRMTIDLDLLISLDENNKSEFYKIMRQLKFKTKKPELAKKLMTTDYKPERIKVVTFFRDEFELIDVFLQPPVDFEEAYAQKKMFNIDNINIPVISFDMLIKMKEQSDRERDLRDIGCLRNIKRAK